MELFLDVCLVYLYMVEHCKLYANVNREMGYSTLFTFWSLSLHLGDIIFAQLACPLNDINFVFSLGVTNLSLWKYC
jgi:hypothetical protein